MYKKKIFGVLFLVFILLATAVLAADLKDYPVPFIANGSYDDGNALIVGGINLGNPLPSDIGIGEGINLDVRLIDIGSWGGPINEPTHVKELYGMCALKDPDENIVWSKGPDSDIGWSKRCLSGEAHKDYCDKRDTASYYCEKFWTFNETGRWKYSVAIAYVDKTWDGTQWNVEEGISASIMYNIDVGIPEPPETSLTFLENLFNLFINSF